LIEGDPAQFEKLLALYPVNEPGQRVWLHNCYVTVDGDTRIDSLLAKVNAPKDLDLLVCDVDGQDYYLFNSMLEYRPRVVLCEYDPAAEPMFIPALGGPGQAGQRAINYVGNARGYTPICRTKTNVVFLRNDIVPALEASVTGESPALASPASDKDHIRVQAIMTTPRYGLTSTFGAIEEALGPLGVPLRMTFGVFWTQCITRAIEETLSGPVEKRPQFILTIDSDGAFTQQDVAKLVCHLVDNPDLDIVVPMQAKRQNGGLLATSNGPVNLTHRLVPIRTGHFGLTLFRASLFDRLPKPWFVGVPDSEGGWDDAKGKVDDDIHFWLQCEKAGAKVALATDVKLGHIEEMVAWIGPDLQTRYQHISEWRNNGKRPPEGV